MSAPASPVEQRLCALDDLAVDAAVRMDLDGRRLAVVRIGDDVYVIGDRCSHADYSLSEGEIDADECTIECPKHGSAFGLTDGAPRSLPAIRPVPVYTVRVDDGVVYVALGDDRSSDAPRSNSGAPR